MTDWTAFAGFSGVVVLLLLALARLSQSMVSDSLGADPGDGADVPRDGSFLDGDDGTAGARDGSATGDAPANPDGVDQGTTPPGKAASGTSTKPPEVPMAPDRTKPPEATAGTPETTTDVTEPGPGATGAPTADAGTSADRGLEEPRAFGSGELLANVLVTHGLFAGLVAAAAVYWEVPASALGVAPPTLPVLGWGVAAGLALYVANEVGAALAARLGIDHEETLRELLAPDSPAGWLILLGGVLPAVAVGEELIFRGVLVGALAIGFGLPPWGLAAASSVAFALGHGAQGTGGIVVTGLLGFALAAAFVLSGSLLLVIVAHYVVNALEIVVHEGFGIEWAK